MTRDGLEISAHQIDKSSPIPFYFQLAKILRDEIKSGTLQPGDELPSEQELCTMFEVSRTTVRQAVADLTSEGFVLKTKGQRSTIASRPDTLRFVQSSIGFFAEGGRIGQVVSSEVLRQERAILPDWVARELEMTPGSTGAIIERVRSVGGDLIMHVVNYLIDELTPTVLSLDLRSSSLYGSLESAGVVAFNGHRLLEAVPAPVQTAGLLNVAAGSPLIRIESVTWDETGRPFECYEAWQRTDIHRIEVRATSNSR